MAYIGASGALTNQATASDVFNGNGSNTVFTLSRNVFNTRDIEVVVNNVQQNPFDGSYSVSGSTLTFSGAPTAGANNIYVNYKAGVIGVMSPTDNSVTANSLTTTAITDKLGFTPANKAGDTFSGNVSFNGSTSHTGSSTFSNTVAIGNSAVAGYRVVIDNSSTTGDFSPLLVKGGSASENGGQVGLYNTYTGVPNPKKWIRVDNSGKLGIINNAYTQQIASIDDSGNLSVAGTLAGSSGVVIQNAVTSIRSTSPTNVNPGTTFVNVNTTYYKWDLPSAGDYILWATLRVRVWGVNTFIKARLYNNTAGAAISNSDTMLLESSNNTNLLNVCCSPIWKFTASGATTVYLQAASNASGEVGIQSDVNGYNECGFVKVA